MLTIYSFNNGKKFGIRLTGPKYTWTLEIYNLAREAQKYTFESEEEAQKWIDERL